MNKNKLPLLLMLVAGSTACIITLVCNYTTLERLVILFCVLLLFYILGVVLKWTMDRFERQNEEKLRAERAAREEAEREAEEKAKGEEAKGEEAKGNEQ